MEKFSENMILDSLHDESLNEGENGIDIEKLPQHVLELIIGFVPCKKSCFLVNKKFKEGTMHVTRNRCYLNLDEGIIKNVDESLADTGRTFDEIRLHFPSRNFSQLSYTTGISGFMKIIERFGMQIKKTLIDVRLVNRSDLLLTLSFMRNLEDLDLSSTDYESTDSAEIELHFLTRLKVNQSALLKALVCPQLRELILSDDYRTNPSNELYSFIYRHSQLKHLILASSSVKEVQKISLIEGLKLSSLEISQVYQARDLPRFCAALDQQNELTTLKLPLCSSLIDNQVLRSILKLTSLETLAFGLYDRVERVSKDLINNVMQMNQLKVINIFTQRLKYIKTISDVYNQRLEELTLDVFSSSDSSVQRTFLQSFVENFPNLKKISLKNFAVDAVINMASQSSSLECVKMKASWFQWINEDFNIPTSNTSICELKLELHHEHCVKIIESLIKTMPNIAKLSFCINEEYNLNPALLNPQYLNTLEQILNFPKLKEFQSSAKCLEQPAIIQYIQEKGKHLEKIVCSEISFTQAQRLSLLYQSQIKFHRIHRNKRELVMMRF